MHKNQRYIELEERITGLKVTVVSLCKKLDYNSINKVLVGQVIRFIGSIGANYCEANEASSLKDTKYKVNLSTKEAKESINWLILSKEANPKFEESLKGISLETKEFAKILATIERKLS